MISGILSVFLGYGTPSKRASRDLSTLSAPEVNPLHLNVKAIAKMTPVTRAGGEKLAGFFSAFGFHTPLLGARHEHRGVERLSMRVRASVSMRQRP